MINSHRVLCVIIGRSGSKGLPGKNARLIAGRPMVSYSVCDARSAGVDRIVVSTDGEDIACAARAAGAEVIDRPVDLATDNARVDDAVRHAVNAVDDDAPIVVILYANVPVRPCGLIERATTELITGQWDSVQSYSTVGKHHPHWMVSLDETGGVVPLRAEASHRRQELPALYIPDGGVIAVKRRSLLAPRGDHPHAFFGERRGAVTNEAGSVVDVDTIDDFQRAESALRARWQNVEPKPDSLTWSDMAGHKATPCVADSFD